MLPRMAPTLSALAAAAGCGALIGSIRQWREQTRHSDDGPDFGGVRTHTLWALLGCIAAGFPWALPVVLVLVASHLVALRWQPGPSADRAPGGTGFAAALLTILVGALMSAGDARAATLVTALTIVLLGLKQPIHDWTRRFTTEDVRAALQFAAITGVILPLVPNRAIDPLEALNPFEIWMMVVLISGLGFAGYVAMRLFGAKAGLTLTAIFGGVASSTASTLAFSRSSRAEPALSEHYAFATVTACTVMLPRIVVAVALFSRPLAQALILPLAVMAAPALLYAAFFALRRSPAADAEVAAPTVSNPLGPITALQFAALYAAVGLLIKLALDQQWQIGLLPIGFITGLTNADAISLQMAQSAREASVEIPLAMRAVVLAAAANSFFKAGMAWWVGAPAYRGRTALVLVATAVIGVAWAFVA
jgi:Predicted membrane protein